MSLLDDIASDPVRPGTNCTVRLTIDALPPDDAADLLRAIEDLDAIGQYVYTGAQISRTLAKRGIRLNDSTIQRHRRGFCLCP